jgi:hypothetical protein
LKYSKLSELAVICRKKLIPTPTWKKYWTLLTSGYVNEQVSVSDVLRMKMKKEKATGPGEINEY